MPKKEQATEEQPAAARALLTLLDNDEVKLLADSLPYYSNVGDTGDWWFSVAARAEKDGRWIP